MKQEDKQLLLKDICARLPYEVKCCFVDIESIKPIAYILSAVMLDNLIKGKDFFKPYLRPMSSMTDEELSEYRGTCRYWNIRGTVIYENKDSSFDWLNAHHIDYRGLIEKGLALEAPEGMYN